MADFKVVFIMNAGRAGFSETYYLQRNTVDLAEAAARDLAILRATMLGKSVVIEGIRTSDINVAGDANFSAINIPAAPGGGAGINNRDQTQAAFLARIMSGTQYRRQWWMRALPDDWVTYTADQGWVPTAQAQAAFNTFGAALAVGQWRIRALSKEAGATGEKRIGSLTTAPSGRFQVNVVAHGYANTNRVRVSAVKGNNVEQVKGVWTIFNVTANSFEIPVPSPGANNFLYKGGGKVRLQSHQLFVINDYAIVRAATRKTGRAFFVQPGRRRARQ